MLSSLAGSQLRLERGATLPRITTLQLGPARDGARLDAQIPQPAVLGFEVAHALDLVLPSVPHRDVGQAVPRHNKRWRATLVDRQSALRSVHAVGLARAGECVGLLGEGLRAAYLVDELRGGKARDRGFVDVLSLVQSSEEVDSLK
jgi:hypothetical protein